MIVNIIIVIVLLISISRYDASPLIEMTLMESNDLLSECLSSPSPSSESSSNEMIERESFCKRIIHLGDADPNALHEITISIKQKGLQWIDETLYAVSDPSSKSYGHHKSYDEIVAKTKNTMGSLIVSQWLQRLSNDMHISAKTENEEYITVQAPVHIIEQVFSTKFLKFGYIDTRNDGDRVQSFVSDDTYICALKYSIPTILVDHIEAVFNTVQLPLALISRKKPNLKKKDILDSNVDGRKLSLDGLTYPQRISDLYGIFSHEGNTMATQAVFATNEQFYSVEDLSIFKSFFKLPVDKPNRVVGGANREVLGVCTDIDRCGEANLDVQYITSIARSTPTTFWYVKTGTAFSSFLYDALNSRDVPKVISISYAMPEVYLSVSEKRMFDLEVKKLGLRGTTVITSSGDEGVSGGASNVGGCGYIPYFPASSPYVITVGGTEGPEVGEAERACQGDQRCGITSGGGFSNVYAMPEWQKAHVDNYFNSLESSELPFVVESKSWRRIFPWTTFNRDGRAYPDISVIGSNFVVIMNGTFFVCSGTSASAPVAAGMFSLINAARLKAGRSSLGFVTPWLYKMNGTFANDVLQGKNNCLREFEGCCEEGFTAKPGWDPVTGWGSLNYGRTYDMFFNLGYPVIEDQLGSSHGNSNASPANGFNHTHNPSTTPVSPTFHPSKNPTAHPSSISPTFSPSFLPTIQPTHPTLKPTKFPSSSPSSVPSSVPSCYPTSSPTNSTINPYVMYKKRLIYFATATLYVLIFIVIVGYLGYQIGKSLLIRMRLLPAHGESVRYGAIDESNANAATTFHI